MSIEESMSGQRGGRQQGAGMIETERQTDRWIRMESHSQQQHVLLALGSAKESTLRFHTSLVSPLTVRRIVT